MSSAKNISIIVAVADRNAIGRNGNLLYRLKPDMRHFKSMTMGHPVIMGRKTWESLPGALPGRRNIVISRNRHYKAEHAEVVGSLKEAIEIAGDEEIFIIGGAAIYAEALPQATRMYLTEIEAPCAGADTFFPDYCKDEWRETEVGFDTGVQTDPETQLRYRFVCLSRK